MCGRVQRQAVAAQHQTPSLRHRCLHSCHIAAESLGAVAKASHVLTRACPSPFQLGGDNSAASNVFPSSEVLRI